MKTVVPRVSFNKTPARKRNRGKSGTLSGAGSALALPDKSVSIQRKAQCACGGSCSRCREQPPVQPKLKIGPTNDKYELQADRVADEVMRMPDPGSSESSGVADQAPEHALQTEHSINALHHGGNPLPASTRAFFEPRIHQDLGHVRIHTHAEASASAQAVGARAYTVGSDIAFARNEFNPATFAGRHLIAHELTHVLQQRGGDRFNTHHASGTAIQRKPDNDSQLLTMPVHVIYIYSTSAEHVSTDRREDGTRKTMEEIASERILWDDASAGAVVNEAIEIMRNGFGIKVMPLLKRVEAVMGSTWTSSGLAPIRMDTTLPQIYLIDRFSDEQENGEVNFIGGNLGVACKRSPDPGRTMAHELGHMLGLYHALVEDPDCNFSDRLMRWGVGKCVTQKERTKARGSRHLK